jgi:diaminopimelate epimerase
MNRLTLSKHHALGNDFLVGFDVCSDPAVDDVAAWARSICDRRRGVGADGLLVGTESDDHDAVMTLFNADGSRAEMSGNGIRCFAQALVARHGRFGDLRIATDAGTRFVTVSPTEDPLTIRARVEMGEVHPVHPPPDWDRLGAHPDRPVAHLSLGNPHSVVGVDDVAAVDLEELGTQVPGVNLEIVEPGPEPYAITMRVHERGVGVTEACGTGACAAAWAARAWGLVGPVAPEILVHMVGGSASVSFPADTPSRAVLAGPATWIATVQVPVP